jgi:hypothetical protein
MKRLRLDSSASCLPPLQLGRSTGSVVAPRLHWSFLIRGLFVLAALALPALGIRLADPSVQPAGSGAMQVAAVLPSPPVRMAATLSPSGAR